MSASTESQLGANKAAEQVKKAEKLGREAEKAPFCVLGNESCDPCKSSEERSPRKAQAKRGGSSRVVLTVGGGVITASEGEVSAIKAKKGRTIIKITQKKIITH